MTEKCCYNCIHSDRDNGLNCKINFCIMYNKHEIREDKTMIDLTIKDAEEIYNKCIIDKKGVKLSDFVDLLIDNNYIKLDSLEQAKKDYYASPDGYEETAHRYIFELEKKLKERE